MLWIVNICFLLVSDDSGREKETTKQQKNRFCLLANEEFTRPLKIFSILGAHT
jgi:hypothetical protein